LREEKPATRNEVTVPEQKPKSKENNTTVLTKSGVVKKVLLAVITGAVGTAFAGIVWVCGTVLTLQKDMTTTKASVESTAKMIEERFKERPDDMAIWEQLHKHAGEIKELQIKDAFKDGRWEGIHKRKIEHPIPEPDDEEAIEKPEPKENGDDTRSFREKHMRPWIQQQQANEPPLMLNRKK